MAANKPEVRPAVTDFLDTIKAVGRYLITPEGIGSTVPGLLSLADASIGFLPISAPVRPTIYFFVLVLVLFAFYYECANYSTTRISSKEFERMSKHARLHISIGILLCAVYLPILALIDDYAPTNEAMLFMLLWVSALLAAIGIMEITRAFVILGLKTFIVRNRA